MLVQFANFYMIIYGFLCIYRHFWGYPDLRKSVWKCPDKDPKDFPRNLEILVVILSSFLCSLISLVPEHIKIQIQTLSRVSWMLFYDQWSLEHSSKLKKGGCVSKSFSGRATCSQVDCVFAGTHGSLHKAHTSGPGLRDKHTSPNTYENVTCTCAVPYTRHYN